MDKKIWIRYAIALTAVLLLLWYVSARNSSYEADSSPILPFDTDEITSLEISSGSESLRLFRTDSLWTFSPGDTLQPAESKVLRCLQALEGEKGSHLTEKADRYSLYNVDSTAMLLKIYTADSEIEALAVHFGRSSSHYNADHIRYLDDPRVYLSKNRVLNTLSTDSSFWQ